LLSYLGHDDNIILILIMLIGYDNAKNLPDWENIVKFGSNLVFEVYALNN